MTFTEEIERAAEAYCDPSGDSMEEAYAFITFKAGAHFTLKSSVVEELHHTLEAVRSVMCWERDRDQLTMGMADLHTRVTHALAAYNAALNGSGGSDE